MRINIHHIGPKSYHTKSQGPMQTACGYQIYDLQSNEGLFLYSDYQYLTKERIIGNVTWCDACVLMLFSERE